MPPKMNDTKDFDLLFEVVRQAQEHPTFLIDFEKVKEVLGLNSAGTARQRFTRLKAKHMSTESGAPKTDGEDEDAGDSFVKKTATKKRSAKGADKNAMPSKKVRKSNNKKKAAEFTIHEDADDEKEVETGYGFRGDSPKTMRPFGVGEEPETESDDSA